MVEANQGILTGNRNILDLDLDENFLSAVKKLFAFPIL